MANNDKLKQIISNLQILSDLSNSMIDSEIYPVSFFSQAFDLIQKIQSDIHTLEADQVELFATQMKKHQALILSIHQQMRNISTDAQEQKHAPKVTATTEPAPTNDAKKPVIEKASQDKVDIPKQKDESPKKSSFFSRLGLYKEKNTAETENNRPIQPTEEPKKNRVVTPAPAIIENPISVPEIKNSESDPKPEREIEKSEIRIPEKTVSTQNEKVAGPPKKENPQPSKPAPSQAPKKESAPADPPAAKIANDNYAEKVANGSKSLNDAIEKNKLSDLRKAFSLNDRFRYRKELFAGNEEVMNKVIAILNNKTSFKDSIMFLEEKLHWDFSNPIVKDFVKVLELRFL